MADARSPNYPAISLEQAVKYAESLWSREHRTAVPPEVAVKAFGYTSLSGTARVALGSLKQYGLLQKAGHGVKLSDLAIRLLNPADSADRQGAIQQAALTPPLFKELYATHARASDEAISSYLLTQKTFVPRGVRVLIKAFRDTIAYAGLDVSGYSGTHVADDGPLEITSAAPSTAYVPDVAPSTPSAKGAGILFLKVPFQDSEITLRIEVTGGRITKKHIERVRKYLALTEEDLVDEWPEGELPPQSADGEKD